MNRPEDRIVGSSQIAKHVAESWPSVEIVPGMETSSGYLYAAIAVSADITLQGRFVRARISILAARPDVHRVVRILIEKTEGRVVEATTAEVAERLQGEDLLHVLCGRVVVVYRLVDGQLLFGIRIVVLRGKT